MVELLNNSKYLIIARNEYHSLVYSLKDTKPFLDFSLITPSQTYDIFNFKVKKEAITYLLKKEKDDYLSIKSKLKLINIADLNKDKELLSLYKELKENNLIEEDELFKYSLFDTEILIVEEKENYELNSFLDRNNIKYKHISLDSLGIKKNNNELKPLLFDSKLHQYLFIFSDIRKKIIKDKVNPNNISILSNDESDLYYLNLCSSLFNIDVDITTLSPLRSNSDISEFISTSFNNKEFDISDIKNEYLIEIFNKYELNELKDFSFAYLNLLEIIQEYKIKYENKKGIKVTDSFNITSDIVYITNFQYDVFYKNYQNTTSYKESDLLNLGLNPSYIKTKLDSIFKYNYLVYSSVIHLSRTISSSSEKIYDSNYIEEELLPIYEKATYNYDGLYTTSSKELVLSLLKDKAAKPSDDIYKSYSNKYLRIPTSIYQKEISKKHPASASMLKSYFSCKYKYYIENILQPDTLEYDKSSALLGTLIHHIFESSYEDFDGLVEEIDFDSIYNSALNKILKDNVLDEYTKELFDLSKRYIQVSYISALRQKKFNPSISQNKDEIEYGFEFNLDKSPFYLKGSIDKIVRINKASNNYYAIIDYKTTKYDYFDFQLVPFGGSLQLPIYYLGLKQDSKFLNLNFGGFFIHNIFSKKIIKSDKLDLDNYYNRLSGLYLYSLDFVSAFDKSSLSESGNKIIGKNNKNFMDIKNHFSEGESISKTIIYTFDDLISDTKKSILNSINGIINNDFSISPKTKDNPDYAPCRYCNNKDICYRRYDDIVLLKPLIEKKFGQVLEEEEV